jgi:anaerobic selenocysteine-containing dehydrogenase
MENIIAEQGPQAILPYSYAGTMGLVQGQGMDRRFFHRMGASLLDRTICASAGSAGYKATLGMSTGPEPHRFAEAKFILIWGSNTLTSNVHLWPFILQAKKSGARVVTIDPSSSANIFTTPITSRNTRSALNNCASGCASGRPRGRRKLLELKKM